MAHLVAEKLIKSCLYWKFLLWDSYSIQLRYISHFKRPIMEVFYDGNASENTDIKERVGEKRWIMGATLEPQLAEFSTGMPHAVYM